MNELIINEMQQVGGGWTLRSVAKTVARSQITPIAVMSKAAFKSEKLGGGVDMIPKEWQERADKGI
jgi:hypothetical protein